MRGMEPRILVGTEGGLRSFGALEVPADALAGHTVTALPRRRLNGPVSIVSSRVDRKSIEKVAAAIAPYVRVTPIVELAGADFGLAPFPLVLKLELLQHSGSFKARGAFANLLMRLVPDAGVVAASGGNHGAAVAHAAKELKVPARIYVPRISSPAKIERIRA